MNIPKHVPRPVNTTEKMSSFFRKIIKGVNFISPETEMKNNPQKGPTEFRQYVFNSQFSTPTSLPLSFFFGYQILHEKKKWNNRGHVSFVINNVFMDLFINYCSTDLSQFFVLDLFGFTLCYFYKFILLKTSCPFLIK